MEPYINLINKMKLTQKRNILCVLIKIKKLQNYIAMCFSVALQFPLFSMKRILLKYLRLAYNKTLIAKQIGDLNIISTN